MILRPLLLTEQPEDGRDNPGPNPLQDRGMTSFPESATGVARGTFAGIGLMLAGTFLFSVNDALGKWLLADYSIGELLLVRSVAGLILLAPLIRQTGIAGFRSAPRPALQIVRVILSTVEVALFFLAVSQLPLADTKA